MEAQRRTRSRPTTFQLAQRQVLADLIRKHGARGANEAASIQSRVSIADLRIAGFFAYLYNDN